MTDRTEEEQKNRESCILKYLISTIKLQNKHQILYWFDQIAQVKHWLLQKNISQCTDEPQWNVNAKITQTKNNFPNDEKMFKQQV